MTLKTLNGKMNLSRLIKFGWLSIRFYPDKITEIDIDNLYTGMEKLPEIIWCDDGSFKFETKWLNIDYKSYFEDLKYRIVYRGIYPYLGTGNSYEDALSNAKDADMNII